MCVLNSFLSAFLSVSLTDGRRYCFVIIATAQGILPVTME